MSGLAEKSKCLAGIEGTGASPSNAPFAGSTAITSLFIPSVTTAIEKGPAVGSTSMRAVNFTTSRCGVDATMSWDVGYRTWIVPLALVTF